LRLAIRLIPPFLVRFFAHPYVAGDSLQKGLDAAARLWRERGLLTTLDLLAEDIASADVVEQNVRVYLDMIEAVRLDDRFGAGVLRPTLSLKLSSYTTDPLDDGGRASGAREAVQTICRAAAAAGVRVTIDMESRHWTDFTLDVLGDLHAQGLRDVGAVLQTRLLRTRKDLDRLPSRCRVRLVIGIYKEPPSVALTDKRAMKDCMLEYGEELLRRGHYVEFATHDEAYVRRFVDDVVPRAGASPDGFELQMLYGVPRDRLLRELVDRGVRARLYVPFANGWGMAIKYLRRRLDEYPAMMWLVARNLFVRG
jgi:proline dehydrogenase